VVVVEGPEGPPPDRFRTAVKRSIASGMALISRLAGLVMVAAVVVLIATGNLFSPSWLVIALQVAAVALALWARLAFAPGQFAASPSPRGEGAGVIRRGPYRLIRHPMYAAALVLIWATVLSHPSLLCLLVGAAVTIVVMPRILDEERRLRGRYPEYADYARSTKALVPFVL